MTRCLDDVLTDPAISQAGDRVCSAYREHNGHINKFTGELRCDGCPLRLAVDTEKIAA